MEAKKKEEHQQALDKRAAYEGIRAELVQKVENKVRAVCDEAETVTAKGYWPLPSYSELLFGVK